MKKLTLIGLVVVAAFALVACDGAGGPDPKAEAAKSAQAKTGNTPHPNKVSPKSGNEGD